MEKTVSARVKINPYVSRVLSMIKIKYQLRDKSEALNKFVEIYGEDILEKETNEEYIKEVLEISGNHFKKHGSKKMNFEELDALCED